MDETRPLETLAAWVRDARGAGLAEHDAAALATVDVAGRPSVRTVSLRRVEEDGLIFTTALWTRKARELRDNPHVALLLHWPSLGRQVQVAGCAAPAERALAEELFARRDRPHQLQAMVSRQGESIADLAPLRARLAEIRRQLGDDPIPCPEDWGAFRVRPDVIEYWTADADALHDRVVLERGDGRWRLTRLAP
jgi:pyridoxamine 5'-phosphate oxidase